MSLEDKVMILAVGPIFLSVTLVLAGLVWTRGLDAYEHAPAARFFVGKSGRDGFNAMFPVAVLSLAFAYLGIVLRTFAGPGAVEALGGVFMWAFLVGLVMSWTLLLWMFPRLAAPAHLRSRDHQGWVLAALSSRRQRRQSGSAS